MKIVLAGGSGQVGAILSRAFAAEGHEVVINLAGRSVNCRYNAGNRREMMESRVRSTVALGRAIEGAARPPRVGLPSSTATI